MAKSVEKPEALLERASPARLRKLIVPGEDEPLAAQALKALTQTQPSVAAELAAEIVASRRYGPSVRSAAAVELGKKEREPNEQALIKALGSPEPEVVRHVVNALGRIGSERALDRLAKFEAPAAAAAGVAEAVNFARTLIAYRLGSMRFPVVPPAITELRAPARETAFPLPVRTLETKRIEPMLAALARELPATALSRRNGLSVRCGASEYRVLLSAETDEPDTAKLLGRPFVAGVLLKYRACSDRFSLDAYLLSSPRDDGSSHIFGIRPSGVMVLAGVAAVEGRKVGFEVATTRSPHFRKIRLQGEVTQAGRFRAIAAEASRELADDGPRRVPQRLSLNFDRSAD